MPTLKIGVVDKAVLSTTDVEALAELPSREILLSQLLGLLLAPATRLVRVLNEPASAFARLLTAKARRVQLGSGGGAPAAEAPLRLRAQKRLQRRRLRKRSRKRPQPRRQKKRLRREQNSRSGSGSPRAESTTGEQRRKTQLNNNFATPRMAGRATNNIVRPGGYRA